MSYLWDVRNLSTIYFKLFVAEMRMLQNHDLEYDFQALTNHRYYLSSALFLQ